MPLKDKSCPSEVCSARPKKIVGKKKTCHLLAAPFVSCNRIPKKISGNNKKKIIFKVYSFNYGYVNIFFPIHILQGFRNPLSGYNTIVKTSLL